MVNQYKNEHGNNDFSHFIPLQIRFNDIDIMGHVNNAVFQHYFDYARIKYFEDVFGEPLCWDKITLILAGINIDFIHPVHIYHEIGVFSKTTLLGNKSLQMIQEVHKLPENKKMAFSQVALVAYNVPAGNSVTIPDSWKQDIINFERKVEFKYSQKH